MKFLKFLFFITILNLVLLASFSYYTYNYFNSPYLKDDVYFVVSKGDNFHNIFKKFSDNNIINPTGKEVFFYVSRILYRNKMNIKAGEYQFLKNDTPLSILKKLQNGNILYRKITFAEGLSNDSILKIIDSTFGLVGDLPSESIPEGTLLPETYLYTFGESKSDIIVRMQKAMIDFFNQEWNNRSTDLPFKTKKEALSLASIVEKETGLAFERGKVASVFVNRLKIGMRLQSDPTVVYSFTKGDKSLERLIRKSDLSRPSEYNTYLIKGIPEKPISNPGKDSIKAVLNPEKTNYLYFVATGNGGHNFSKNLKEHNRFVLYYRKILGEEKE